MKITLTLLAALLLPLSARAQTEWEKWKERGDALQQDSALLSARGERESSRLRAEALVLRQARLEALGAIQGIQPDKVNEGERDKTLALLAARKAEHDYEFLELSKRAPPLEGRCQTGGVRECQELATLRRSQLEIRRELAQIATERARAELKLSELRYTALVTLVSNHAVDKEVLAEAELNVKARRNELQTATEQHQLAIQALQ
jgi:hypothetical protein